jgi:Domain of unknown function (DUF4160)
MPTVLRIAGLRFVLWPNDHAPPHVHGLAAEGEATIDLGKPDGFPELIKNRRMSNVNLANALQGVREHRSLLLQKWYELHG